MKDRTIQPKLWYLAALLLLKLLCLWFTVFATKRLRPNVRIVSGLIDKMGTLKMWIDTVVIWVESNGIKTRGNRGHCGHCGHHGQRGTQSVHWSLYSLYPLPVIFKPSSTQPNFLRNYCRHTLLSLLQTRYCRFRDVEV